MLLGANRAAGLTRKQKPRKRLHRVGAVGVDHAAAGLHAHRMALEWIVTFSLCGTPPPDKVLSPPPRAAPLLNRGRGP